MFQSYGVVIGGVGPEAGVAYKKKLVDGLGEHCKTDQEYPPTVLITEPSGIGDRTGFLEEKFLNNPGEGASQLVENFVRGFGERYKKFIISVPCNTFHSPPIFEKFLEGCTGVEGRYGVEIEVVNLIQVTAEHIGLELSNVKNIGLMSTTGTRQQKLYHRVLEDMGYNIIEVSEEQQAQLHETIYNKEWGIKGGGATAQAVSNFENYATILKQNGAEVIILGCSEIPLVFEGNNYSGIDLIDPVEVMANWVVQRLLEN
jgi:aspartate racemase